MSLEEAIIHCDDIASTESCVECANDHKQLASWLRELKLYRLKFGRLGCEENPVPGVDYDD